MGAGNSRPRKLSINNDDCNIITMSEDVVERITSSAMARVSSNENQFREPILPSNAPGGPTPIYSYVPTITAHQIQQEKEAELASADKYWAKRVEDMERNYDKIHRIMEKEYEATVNQVQEEISKIHAPKKEVCKAGKAALLACYKMNPKETMRCANEFQAFSACIDSTHVSSMETKSP